MAIERLENWQKWLMGIVTAFIIAGVPATVGYVISIHDTLAQVEATTRMINYRIDRLEDADKQIASRQNITDAELKKQSMDVLSIHLQLTNSYEARARIP